MVFLKDFFSKKLILKKNQQITKRLAKLPSMQRVNSILLTAYVYAKLSENETKSELFSYWELKFTVFVVYFYLSLKFFQE